MSHNNKLEPVKMEWRRWGKSLWSMHSNRWLELPGYLISGTTVTGYGPRATGVPSGGFAVPSRDELCFDLTRQSDAGSGGYVMRALATG